MPSPSRCWPTPSCAGTPAPRRSPAGPSSLLASLSLLANGLGASGSFAFGAYWLGVGLTFTGITAVAAQLTETSRGCAAWALGALGLTYVLRALGDTSTGAGSALTWLSPFGWGEKLEVFGANRLVVLLIPLVATVALVGLAYALLERRDLGAGMLASRPGPGPARGAASLSSPLALAWRLQRGALYGWLIGFTLFGLVLGGVSANVGALVSDPQVEEMLRKIGGDATTLSDVFLSAEIGFLSIAAAAYGISAALRLKSEEANGHTEQILATCTSRPALLASHATIALLGSAALLIAFGFGLSVSSACVGLALAIFGALPRIVTLAWALLAAFVVIGEFGVLLSFPTAVTDLSPFAHGAVVPGGTVHATPLLILFALAAVLAITAAATFRRRDLITA